MGKIIDKCLYKHKNREHVIRLISTPYEYTDNTPDDQIEGLLQYAYCQRQQLVKTTRVKSIYVNDPAFQPFLVEIDRFPNMYIPLEVKMKNK